MKLFDSGEICLRVSRKGLNSYRGREYYCIHLHRGLDRVVLFIRQGV